MLYRNEALCVTVNVLVTAIRDFEHLSMDFSTSDFPNDM